MPGPDIHTDLVDVYVFRACPVAASGGAGANTAGGATFLQMRRVNPPMAGSWQPVMGHIEQGETAAQAALRELAEETGFAAANKLTGFWQLEMVNTFFLASLDRIVMSPCFAARVAADAEPAIDAVHDAHRWVPRDHADRAFLWPGQRAAVEHITRDLLAADSPMEPLLRVPF